MPIERVVTAELVGGEPLWFVEVDSAAAGSLRLFLVVDCSDSFFAKLGPSLERLLVPLLDKLVSNDRVDVWLLGESQARQSVTVAVGATGRSAYGSVRAALRPTHGGTWLDPTLPRIFGSTLKRGETPVLVLLTDGEAFDAGRDLGRSFERALVLGPARNDRLAALVPGASVADFESATFGTLFERPAVRTSLELEWAGRVAYGFESESRPNPTRLGNVRQIADQNGVFRVALVGGNQPRLAVGYETDREHWREELDVYPTTLSRRDDPALDYLRLRLDGLELRVRQDADAAVEEPTRVLECRYCGCKFQASELLSKPACDDCKALRLFEGLAFERDEGANAAVNRWRAAHRPPARAGRP